MVSVPIKENLSIDLHEATLRFRPALVTFAYRMLQNLHEAEDAVQTALTRAVTAMVSGDSPTFLRAWLYKIVLREVQKIIEKRKVRKKHAPHVRNSFSDKYSNASSEESEQLELQGRVLAEVNELPEQYQKIVLLRFCQHMSYEEVAETLDVPVGTVKSYQSRALGILHEKLSKDVL